MGQALPSRGLTVTKHTVKWPGDPCHPGVTVFILPLATVNSRWGNRGPEKGKALLGAPFGQIRRAAGTVPHLEPCQEQSPALQSTVSPHPTLRRGSGSGGQTSSSEVAARPQPSPGPVQRHVPAASQLHPVPRSFPTNTSPTSPTSQVLGHCPFLLVAEARMDVERGSDWAGVLGPTPVLWDLMLPPWEQAPRQVGKPRPEVRREELKAMAWLSQGKLPPEWGCCPQEAWPWGPSQDLGQ